MTARVPRGFTLIELLVVIAIIGVLSSVVLVSLNAARVRAGDAKVRADFRNIQAALYLYHDTNNSMPPNKTSGAYPSTSVDWLDDLVSAGFLAEKPVPPSGYVYYYYNYGSGSAMGAMLATTLKAATPSLTGLPGSCRPFSGYNWCRNDVMSNSYCICSQH